MRSLIPALAALSMAIAPVAANAGTRAGDVVPAAAKIERDTAPVSEASELGRSGIIIAIASVAVIVGLAIWAFDGDDDEDGLTEG